MIKQFDLSKKIKDMRLFWRYGQNKTYIKTDKFLGKNKNEILILPLLKGSEVLAPKNRYFKYTKIHGIEFD